MQKIELIQGDCLVRMKEIPDGSIAENRLYNAKKYKELTDADKYHKWDIQVKKCAYRRKHNPILKPIITAPHITRRLFPRFAGTKY